MTRKHLPTAYELNDSLSRSLASLCVSIDASEAGVLADAFGLLTSAAARPDIQRPEMLEMLCIARGVMAAKAAQDFEQLYGERKHHAKRP